MRPRMRSRTRLLSSRASSPSPARSTAEPAWVRWMRWSSTSRKQCAKRCGLLVGRVFPTAESAAAPHRRLCGWEAQRELAEVRPGNYVFDDATQVALGVVAPERCALTVLDHGRGKPIPDRLILDAGSKAIGKEVMGPATEGYGHVVGRNDLVISRMYEEHSIVDTTTHAAAGVRVGDRVEVLPNHACAATTCTPSTRCGRARRCST